MLNCTLDIFLVLMYEILPRGCDLGDEKLPCPEFPTYTNGYPGIRVPGAQIGKYEVFLVPVTGISKPGNTHAYPGNWQKGNTFSVQMCGRGYVCDLIYIGWT